MLVNEAEMRQNIAEIELNFVDGNSQPLQWNISPQNALSVYIPAITLCRKAETCMEFPFWAMFESTQFTENSPDVYLAVR